MGGLIFEILRYYHISFEEKKMYLKKFMQSHLRISISTKIVSS